MTVRDAAAAESAFLQPMPILFERLMRLFARILHVTGFSYAACGGAASAAEAEAEPAPAASDIVVDKESLLYSPNTPNSDFGRVQPDLLFAAAVSLLSRIGVAPVTGEYSPLAAGVGVVVVAVSDVDFVGEACNESCVRAVAWPRSVTHASVEASDTGESCGAGA